MLMKLVFLTLHGYVYEICCDIIDLAVLFGDHAHVEYGLLNIHVVSL